MLIGYHNKIAVIGAGLCGSFLSYLLAQRGFSDITLFEKKPLSDSKRLGKVCGGCLHHRAVEILTQYGLTETVRSGTKITKVSVISPEGSSAFVLNHGSWVNRRELDLELLNAAKSAGVKLLNHQAKILEAQSACVSFNQKQEQFDLIIDCGGIAGSALPEWPQQRRSVPGFGFQGYIDLEQGTQHALLNVAEGEVRFFIDDSGYHGLVRVDGQAPYLHVASYLCGTKLQTSSFLKQYFSLESLLERSATTPLGRKRLAARGRVLLCGDALGYQEPFSGEGMRFALQSAEKLAALISQCASKVQPHALDYAKLWTEQVKSLQSRQWLRCSGATWMIKTSLRRKLSFPVLPYIAPIASRVW